ncbi:hypothetical protein TNCV_1053071 [Trichonephila clavipes]|nr:hypothetical protein TNCV_1053071 [Trichonephila clavipes]
MGSNASTILIDTLILSMGRRCETCLAISGDHIPLLKTGCFLLDTHHRDVSAFSRIVLHATFSIKLLFNPLISLLDAAVAFQRVQTCSIGERSGDLAGHRRTSYPLKTLLGESRNDRVSQEIAPHTVTPCEIAVCRSTINAGSDRWPVRLQTRVRWSSSLRLNRDSSLKMTRLQSVTLQVARGRQKIQSTLPMMWGQW